MDKSDLAPIVLFVYNRPWHTQQTLEALMKNDLADESELFIYSDGLKNGGNEIDLEKIHKVREVIHEKQWCKSVNIIEREENLGLADSVITGVTEIIKKYEKVIVLEDDIVTSPGFLQFMNNALITYEKDKRVMHISGYWFPVNSKRLPRLFFYQVPSCWGWASWRESWSYLNTDAFYLYKEIRSRDKDFNKFNIYCSDFSSQLKRNISKEINTWAVKWYASVYLRNGLSLHPRYSFVNNIGHDGTGQNSTRSSRFSHLKLSGNQKIDKIPLKISKEAISLMRDFYCKHALSLKSLIKKIWATSPSDVYNRLKQKKIDSKPEWVKIEDGPAKGLMLYLDVNSFIGWKEMVEGKYDLVMFNRIRKLESEVKVVYDVGAHFGYSSMVLRTLFKNTKVYAFEPNEANLKAFNTHLSNNNISGIAIVPVAISDFNGKSVFFANNDVQSSRSTGSFLEGTLTPLSSESYQDFVPTEVKVKTLDAIIEEKFPAPDLIKIDVEGAENKVLRGASKLLKNKPKLLIEIHSIRSMYDVLNLLKDYGYKSELLDDPKESLTRCFMFCE